MPTFNANVLPSSTGFDLGSASAKWDLFAQLLSAERLNNIRQADQFSGADGGAKITAAISDLP